MSTRELRGGSLMMGVADADASPFFSLFPFQPVREAEAQVRIPRDVAPGDPPADVRPHRRVLPTPFRPARALNTEHAFVPRYCTLLASSLGQSLTAPLAPLPTLTLVIVVIASPSPADGPS